MCILFLTLSKSHPVRVRGLKPQNASCWQNQHKVAPRAGAWIETKKSAKKDDVPKVAPRAGAWIETSAFHFICSRANVAPRAGAWIETIMKPQAKKNLVSHPVRVRGLKLSLLCVTIALNVVAPRAGAWIETSHWVKRKKS